MSSCGNVHSKKELKSSSGEENGDESATLRKPATNINRLSIEWNPQRIRWKGRPKESWRRAIQQEYEDLGMAWKEVKQTAKNRVQWKAVEEALCSGTSEED